MSKENELKQWLDFLTIKASKCCNPDDQETGLTRKQTNIFLKRFPTPDEQDFDSITHKFVADELFPRSVTSENSLRGQLRNIYSRLGFGAAITVKNHDKAKQVFKELKKEFQEWQRFYSCSTSSLAIDNPVAAKLNEYLLSLNYKAEEVQFHNEIENLSQVGVFLSEINGSTTQRWLANRLMANSPILKSVDGRGIKAHSDWRGNLDDFFWPWIAKIGSCDPIKKVDVINNPIMKEDIVNNLFQQIQEKSKFLVIYDVDRLRKQELEIILHDFCHPLQAQIRNSSSLNENFCVLFLTGKIGWINRMEGFTTDEASRILLPIWNTVNAKHIEGWLKAPEIRNFFEDQSCKSYPDILDYMEIDQSKLAENPSLEEPGWVLENICNLLKLPNGIAELEPYWKIAT